MEELLWRTYPLDMELRVTFKIVKNSACRHAVHQHCSDTAPHPK